MSLLFGKPLSQALAAIRTFPGAIYVWVRVAVDGSENQSIRIGAEQAIEWCEAVAKDHGEVPFIITPSNEIFLGQMPLK